VAQYKCRHCSFIYDEEEGCDDYLLPDGTRRADVPDDSLCPESGACKDEFEPADY